MHSMHSTGSSSTRSTGSTGSTDSTTHSPEQEHDWPPYCNVLQISYQIGETLCGPFSKISFAFLISIVVLLVIDRGIHMIEHKVRDSPYETVVNKIYKEMTALGCLTFMTLVITIKTDIPEDWHHCISHADFVVFVMSVSYVLQVSVYMYLSYIQDKAWKVAAQVDLGPLLMEFEEENYYGIGWWLPFAKIRDQLEFKIFLSVFCQKFLIRKTEFNFASYLSESFKRYIIGLLEENLFIRMLFAFLIGLNAARVLAFEKRKMGMSCDVICAADRELIFFTTCGWALVFCVFLLMYSSRLYLVRLLALAGVNSVDEYRTFLLTEEKGDVDKLRAGPRRQSISLSKHDLKSSVESYNAGQHNDDDVGQGQVRMEEGEGCFWWMRRAFRPRTSSKDDEDEENEAQTGNAIRHQKSKRQQRLQRILSMKVPETSSTKPQGLKKGMSFQSVLSLNRVKKTMATHSRDEDSGRIAGGQAVRGGRRTAQIAQPKQSVQVRATQTI